MSGYVSWRGSLPVRITLYPCVTWAQAGLDACTEQEAPILRLLHWPCPGGVHGFRCDVRWDLQDQFLPTPRRWLRQWNASRGRAVDCQRGLFDALAEVITRQHWEQEWDAQPFRIAAAPPRTMGKMVHQLVTANYFHLTSGPSRRPLRRAALPGSYIRALPQPGFRWNVLDYGGGTRQEIDYKQLTTMRGNVFSRPLSTGKRCAGVRAAWHCLWQRFPGQTLRPAPAAGTPIGDAAVALYNLSMSGKRQDGLVQYIVASVVANVFTTVTPQVHDYIREHLRKQCHRGGPHCGGTMDELSTPIAAVHVRHGDSCDRHAKEAGPFNAMFAFDKKLGKLERTSYRYCYDWSVYRQQLETLQRLYNVRTVILATDDHTGTIIRGLANELSFNWLYLEYPRSQFQKRAWMEFRSDLDENAPFSLAAELELLSEATLFVGNMGSHTSRMMYMKMVASTKTAVLPPFISVDGYGLCCGFTESCSIPDIKARRRKIRSCIYTYGLATGGDAYFFHNG
ncbi:hypothetical protein AB1Y20_017337 [Prymnesium parvum]|uniref:O-fucosyltransferase family protein n=1 Tax=Prymnesium parvum TaxID=97485 RepID=A0AB34JJW9_PRYPA